MKPMRLQPVESSALIAAGYDAAAKVLRALFRGGRLYDYLDVPRQSWAAFRKAESKGTYINAEIKPKHRFRRVK